MLYYSNTGLAMLKLVLAFTYLVVLQINWGYVIRSTYLVYVVINPFWYSASM